MGKVDFREVAEGVTRKSESKATTPETRGLIRALLRRSAQEAPAGDLRDFVRALVEGRPDHASSAHRALITAVLSGQESTAPYDQRDLARALIREYDTAHRRRGLSAGLEAEDLEDLNRALRSHSEREIDWPELRSLARALIDLNPSKAPTSDWQHFVEALRTGRPEEAPSSLESIARAAILRESDRAPSGWPRTLAAILVANKIPKHVARISAEKESDLRGLVKAVEKGDRYAVSIPALRDLEEALRKGEKWRAPEKYRGFVDALLKGEPWRAPEGELREIAKAVVKKQPGELPRGVPRELATALVDLLEPAARAAGARPGTPGNRPNERKEPESPASSEKGPLGKWIAAGLLATGSEDTGGYSPVRGASRMGGPASHSGGESSAWDDVPEVQEELSEEAHSEAPDRARPPLAPASVPVLAELVRPPAAGAVRRPMRGALAAFFKASLVAILALVALIGLSSWFQTDRPSDRDPGSRPTQTDRPSGGSAGGAAVGSPSFGGPPLSDTGSIAPGTDTAASGGDSEAVTPTPSDDASPSEGTVGPRGDFGEAAERVSPGMGDAEGSGRTALKESSEPQSAPATGAARPKTPAELAWWNGDWNAAYTIDLAPAEAGDHEAQVRLGRLFYDGLGRQADPRTAEAWFRQAARAGSAEAKYRLGLLYSENRPNAPWNLDMARQFFVEAAGTHALAALKLGHLYAKGIGVAEDREQARKWFQQAALLGNAEADDWLRSNR